MTKAGAQAPAFFITIVYETLTILIIFYNYMYALPNVRIAYILLKIHIFLLYKKENRKRVK